MDMQASLAGIDSVQLQLQKPKPHISYDDLPKAVREEFEELLASRDELERRFRRKVDDLATAEDLASGVYEVLVRKLCRGEYTFRHSQRQYAAGIASNLLLEHWRRVKIQVKDPTADPNSKPEWINAEVLTSDYSTLDDKAIADEFEAFNETEGIKELFQHCAQTLSPYQITVFYLYTVCELPYEEISLILDRTPNALRGCHKQALDKIRADAVGIADLRLATRHLAYTAEETKKIHYTKRKAVARKRFGSQK